MSTPLFFDRTTFEDIPADKGIYAFFLNFEFVIRSLKAHPNASTDFTKFVEKAVRAHTTGNPETLELRLFRKKTFTSLLSLEPSHHIRCGTSGPALTQADMRTLADVLEKCNLFAGPLYIGITAKQTLRKRFSQHRRAYDKYKKSLAGKPRPKDRDMYRAGECFTSVS